MKKFTKVVSLMLAAILMMALCTACGGDSKKDDSTITFGTNAEFPPFEYVTAKGVIGEFDGIDMAIAKHIYRKEVYLQIQDSNKESVASIDVNSLKNLLKN